MVNISSWTELNAIRNDESFPFQSYILLKDLKITDDDYDGIGNNWEPLPAEFAGSFDGSGHYIEGLNNTLFTSLNGGNVRYLGIKDINTTNRASIAISCMFSNVNDCYATGIVNSTGGHIGGLIAEGTSGNNILRCYANVAVTSSGSGYSTGGLVGYFEGEIRDSYSVGNVVYDTEYYEFGGGFAGTLDTEPINCGWLTSTSDKSIGNINGLVGNVTYDETSISSYYSNTLGVYSTWNFTNYWKDSISALPVHNPIGLKPEAVTLSISKMSDSNIILNWTESSVIGGELIGYKIERESPKGNGFVVLVANTNSLELEYEDTNIEIGNEYLYKVYALSYSPTSSDASNIVYSVAKTPSFNITDEGIEIPTNNYQYFGDSSTDGSLRIYNNSGTYTLQKRISGMWTAFGTLSGTNTGDQDLSGLVEEAPIDGKQYARKDADWVEVVAGANKGISFDIDGFGIVPEINTVGGFISPFDGTITGWKIIETNGISSSIVLTIKKNGSAISGTEKPTLSSQSTNEDLSLSTWTTSISKGDVITATIDSASVGTKFNCVIYVE